MEKQLFFTLVFTILLVSCQREQDLCGAPDINAAVESEQKTRTSLSVDESGAGTIYWNHSDQIDVFFGTKKTQYTSQNASDAIAATFKTSDSVSGTDVSSTNIWGLYPSNSSSSCNGSSITTTLPSTQYGVPNTFDKDIFPAVAHSSSTSLQFYNVCGGIKFNLAYDDIKKITFRGNNNEDLAGTVSISFVDNLPKADVVNGVKEITLTPKTGTTFTKGADYYFILLPVTLSAGFTITFTATDGTTGTLNYTDNPVTIKRSIFGKKGNLDVYAAFADERQPNNVIYYKSTDGKIVTPRSTNVFGTSIVSNEYIGGQGVLSFDGSVTNIGYLAFFGCSSLASIEIPHSVVSIGNESFVSCLLTSFELPNSVTRYYKSLRLCPVLESIVVEPGNPSYDSRGGCNAIIETATNTLIDGCKNTVIPNSVTRIGDSAFDSCSGLTSIIIPNSVTDIATYGFKDTDLTSIDIPNSVTSIGFGAFSSTKLTSVSIPASVVSLGRWSSSSSSRVGNPFYSCSDLSSITVNPNNPSYDSRNNCNAIINSVTNELVSGCKNTIIPTSVSSIGNYAFYYCRSLTSIDIPNSVTNFGDYAFEGCSGLTSIKVYALTPPTLGTTVFEYTNSCPIYVPAQSVDAYKTADGWSEYADRIQAIPDTHEAVDLGLPSGIKWATCNVGASSPEEYGDYFAWGETEPKSDYSWATYKWCNGSKTTLTKYNTNSDYGAVDNKTVLELGDDAAYVNWGGSWRMPTDAEYAELRENCTWQGVTLNGVHGVRVTSNVNGNWLFIPDAGGYSGTNLFNVGYGHFWSSSLYPGDPICAIVFSTVGSRDGSIRVCGYTVRPVSE